VFQMSLAPLLNAAPAIPLHAFAAAPKGTLPHRTIGWIWEGLMAAGAVSSFWIHQIRLVGPWSPIHLLSIFTLLVLPLGVWRAHRHRVADHRRIMFLVSQARLSSPDCSPCCQGGSCMRWYLAHRGSLQNGLSHDVDPRLEGGSAGDISRAGLGFGGTVRQAS
jgi:uncharacterized membrane protein